MPVKTLVRGQRGLVALVWLHLSIGLGAALIATAMLRVTPAWPPRPVPLVRPDAIEPTEWATPWTAALITPAEAQAAGVEALFSLLVLLALAAMSMALINVVAIVETGRVERRRDQAVRTALGASPARLFAERAAEAALLHGGGVLVSAMAAAAGFTLLRRSWPPGLVPVERAGAAVPAAIASAALLLLAGMAVRDRRFGIARAMLPSGVTDDRGESRGHAGPVVAGIALAFALASTSALLYRHARPEPAGDIVPETDLATFGLSMVPVAPRERAAAWAELLERVRAVAGTGASTLASPGAWIGAGMRDRVLVDCGACSRGGMPLPLQPAFVTHHAVGPGFFEALEIPVTEGRAFEPTDSFDAGRVAIVNESFARTRFERGRPIGRGIQVGGLRGPWYTVVGVVADRPAGGLGVPRGETPVLYLSILQLPPTTVGLAVRTPLEPATFAGRLAPELAAPPGIDLTESGALAEHFERAIAPLRWFAALLAALAAAAIAIAWHGVYALVRSQVLHRRRELAVRSAVGASPRKILRLVLGRTARMTAAGLAFGTIVAWTAGRTLQLGIAGLPSFDLLTASPIALAIAIAALAGATPPGLRAAVSPPGATLRGE